MMNKSIIILILHLALYNHCLCQVSDLDSNFGNEGITTLDFDSSFDVGRDIALQTDGKILIAGQSNSPSSSFALARFNSTGTLDESFGNGGKVITEISNVYDSPFAMAVQDDLKIILAGYSSYDPDSTAPITSSFTLVRYLANGLIDVSFGEDGIVKQDFGGSFRTFRALTIQEDDKILAAGDSNVGSNKEFVLMRFNANGGLDNTFGDEGIFHASIGSTSNTCNSIAVQPDSKIVLAGTGLDGSVKSIVAIRLNTNGPLDNTFGAEGKISISISGVSDICKSVVLQSDGKILLAGEVFVSSGNFDFALIRLNENGTPDNTFGNNGMVFKNILGDDICNSVIVQSNGDILLTGITVDAMNDTKVAITRFKDTGILDNSFGINGALTISSDNDDDWYYAVKSVAQLDGKIVLGGYGKIQGGFDFILMRIITDLELGVLDNKKHSDLLFYPNPINEVGTLKFELLSNQQVSVVLTEISGRVIKMFVQQKMFPAGKVEEFLDFSTIKAGAYILTIKTRENQTSIKVLK